MTNAMNWGETKGEAISNKITYMKLAKGENRIRVVGNILRRYVYWLENVDGKKLSFENLDFNRDTERFENTGLNPIKELGIQDRDFTGKPMFNKDGSPKPLGSKKAYMCPVINRATNEVEYMELKKGVFDGIKEVMCKLNDPKQRRRFADADYAVRSPMDIDIIFTRSGDGLTTEYKVDLIETMDMVQDDDSFKALKAQFKSDESVLDGLAPIEEVFPRQTYSEQKASVAKFLAGKDAEKEAPAENEDAGGTNWNVSASENEAMDELDD